MIQEKNDTPGYISQNEYQEEIEREVALHTARVIAGGVPKNYKKHTRIEIPKFNEQREELDWWLEQIRRCQYGYDGLSGRMYEYFHFSYIRHKKKGSGRIPPEFRTIDNEWFKFLEEVEKTPGKGIVCIKRRQVGMSWKMAFDALWCCSNYDEYMVGMNSKTESDSWDLLGKVKYLHRNLPPQLRAIASSTDRRDQIEFAKRDKDDQGNRTRIGRGSSIKCKAPTDNAHASEQYTKLIIDEGGEILNLDKIWSTAEPCLEISPGIREGTPIIFGSVGDIVKGGKGLMDFWTNAELYNMAKFAFWGYNACLIDDLGNDLIEDSIRWILYERKRREGGSRTLYHKFIQNYPLTEEDAFLTAEASGVGNPLAIKGRILELKQNPPKQWVGWMKPKPGGGADFYPDPSTGQIIIYEMPSGRKGGYVAAHDSAEGDDVEKTRDTSFPATTIMSRPLGLVAPKIVAKFCDRPAKLDKYFEQLALLLIFYGCQLDIELNKGGWRMLKWFEMFHPELLALAPLDPTNLKLGIKPKVGVKMTTITRPQMMSALDEYLENHLDSVPDIQFLEHCLVFGSEHRDDDLAVSVGWNLLRLQSNYRLDEVRKQTEAVISGGARLVNKNGKLQWDRPSPTEIVKQNPMTLSEALTKDVRGSNKGQSGLFKR